MPASLHSGSDPLWDILPQDILWDILGSDTPSRVPLHVAMPLPNYSSDAQVQWMRSSLLLSFWALISHWEATTIHGLLLFPAVARITCTSCRWPLCHSTWLPTSCPKSVPHLNAFLTSLRNWLSDWEPSYLDIFLTLLEFYTLMPVLFCPTW